MRRINIALALTILLVMGGSAHAQTPAAFRVLLGVEDTTLTRWDGSFKIRDAGQYTLEPWRFDGGDIVEGEIFRLSTRPGHFFNSTFLPPNGELPVANGFIITATAVGDNSEFSFSTAQGDFGFLASEVRYGRGIYKLGGRVYVDRVPVATRLTDTPEEEDYPALAAGVEGDIWLAYVQFHHSPDADKLHGTSNFAKVTIIRDGKLVYSSAPQTREVEFSWRDNQPDKGKTSYYYVRGEQNDGEIVWVSPMWIKYTGN